MAGRISSRASRTGNIKLSADRAPVDPSHIYRLRKKDAEFAAAWNAARSEAAFLLGESLSPSRTRCSGDAHRGELVLTKTRRGRAHLRVPRANGWTRAKEAVFLKTLASTCNVLVAAKVTGVSASGAYQRRMRWAGFEAAWAEAVDNGMLALEQRLVAAAINSLEYEDDISPDDVPLVSAEHAIRLLTIHQRQRARDARQGGRLTRSTEEETYKTISRELAKLKLSEAKAAARAKKIAALRRGGT